MGKIIDQKGRVLGVINIIDLSVIIILISFLSLIFVGYRMISHREKTLDTKWVNVKIKLAESEPEFNNIIPRGDIERDSFGKTIGKLISIKMVNSQNALTSVSRPDKKDFIVDADILCLKKSGVLYYKAAPIKIGNRIAFETDLYNLSGMIVGLKIDEQN